MSNLIRTRIMYACMGVNIGVMLLTGVSLVPALGFGFCLFAEIAAPK